MLKVEKKNIYLCSLLTNKFNLRQWLKTKKKKYICITFFGTI